MKLKNFSSISETKISETDITEKGFIFGASEDGTIYLYGVDVTETALYSFIAVGDTITLDGCLNAGNDGSNEVNSVFYDDVNDVSVIEIEPWTDPETGVKQVFTDELLPLGMTIHIEKIVDVINID